MNFGIPCFFAWPFFPFKGCASDVRWGLDRGGKTDGLKAESHAATRVVHSNSLDSHSSATIDLDDNNETWSFDPSQDRCDFLGNRWDHKRFGFLNLCWKGLRSQLDDAEPLVATIIIRPGPVCCPEVYRDVPQKISWWWWWWWTWSRSLMNVEV